MKRPFKTAAAVIFLAVLLSLFAPAFAATTGNVKKYSSMLVIGDSIVCASELPTVNDFAPAANSYSDVLSKELGLDSYKSLAFRGARVIDVLYLLGTPPKNYDDYYSRQYIVDVLGLQFWDMVMQTAEGKNPAIGDPLERVAEADLIVLQIGNNDICGCPFNLAYQYQNSLLADGMNPTLASAMGLQQTLNLVSTGLSNFNKYYPALLQRIRTLNPDADFVLVGNYNPLYKTSLIGESTELALGRLMGTMPIIQNSSIRKLAKDYNAIYVDTFALSDKFPPQNYSFDGTTRGMVLHPNVEGHKWIAGQIMSALPSNEEKLRAPADGSVRLAFGGWDAGVYNLKRELLLYSIKDDASGKYLSTAGNGELSQSENEQLWWYDGGFFRYGKISVNSSFGFKYLKFSRAYLDCTSEGVITTSPDKVKADMYRPG